MSHARCIVLCEKVIHIHKLIYSNERLPLSESCLLHKLYIFDSIEKKLIFKIHRRNVLMTCRKVIGNVYEHYSFSVGKTPAVLCQIYQKSLEFLVSPCYLIYKTTATTITTIDRQTLFF